MGGVAKLILAKTFLADRDSKQTDVALLHAGRSLVCWRMLEASRWQKSGLVDYTSCCTMLCIQNSAYKVS